MTEPTNNKTGKVTTELPAWMAWAGDWMLRLRGWKRVGERPENLKFIGICAPHTSNWDVYYFLGMAWSLRVRVRYLVKHTLFWWPLGPFLRWTGAVPVNRSGNLNVVKQVAAEFAKYDTFVLGVAAEGTRKRATGWKSGFYWMAVEAKVPLMCAFVDYKRKEAGVGPMFFPSGDLDEDFKIVQAFYAEKFAKFEDRRGPIVLENKVKKSVEHTSPPADPSEAEAP